MTTTSIETFPVPETLTAKYRGAVAARDKAQEKLQQLLMEMDERIVLNYKTFNLVNFLICGFLFFAYRSIPAFVLELFVGALAATFLAEAVVEFSALGREAKRLKKLVDWRYCRDNDDSLLWPVIVLGQEVIRTFLGVETLFNNPIGWGDLDMTARKVEYVKNGQVMTAIVSIDSATGEPRLA